MPARHGRGLACLIAALLAGCAPPPPQPPLLSLSRTDCDAQPDFAAALPVRTDDRGGTSAMLGEPGRCLVVPGGAPTTYAVFALPAGPEPYTLEIVSSVVPDAIVRPVATLFDAPGQPVRTLPPSEFRPAIVGLLAGVRPHGTERFLVVSADQAQLGQVLQLRLGEAENPVRLASAVIILPIVPPPVPDLVRQRSASFGLNGRITVIAAPARSARLAAVP